jgi:hypothetical protein
MNWVVQEKIHTPPTEEISAVRTGRGEKLFLIIVNVLGHPKGVNFLCGGGMDVFWNDPFSVISKSKPWSFLEIDFIHASTTAFLHVRH